VHLKTATAIMESTPTSSIQDGNKEVTENEVQSHDLNSSQAEGNSEAANSTPVLQDALPAFTNANYLMAERRCGSTVYLIYGYGHLLERVHKNIRYLKCMNKKRK